MIRAAAAPSEDLSSVHSIHTWQLKAICNSVFREYGLSDLLGYLLAHSHIHRQTHTQSFLFANLKFSGFTSPGIFFTREINLDYIF